MLKGSDVKLVLLTGASTDRDVIEQAIMAGETDLVIGTHAGEIVDHCVTCPVHQWKFDLRTGYCAGTDDVILKRYECRVENGAVLADLSKPLPVPPSPKYEF